MSKKLWQDGFSTVSILVALTILTAMAAGVSKVVGRTMKTLNSTSMRSDISAIKYMIQSSVDCANTLGPNLSNCPANANDTILLKNKVSPLTNSLKSNGNFKGSGEIFSNWYVKATCNKPNNTLIVRVAKAEGKNFKVDPLTNKLMNFSRFSALFGTDNSLPLCESAFANNGIDCKVGNLRFNGSNLQYCDSKHAWVDLPSGSHSIRKIGSGSLTIDSTSMVGELTDVGSGEVIQR